MRGWLNYCDSIKQWTLWYILILAIVKICSSIKPILNNQINFVPIFDITVDDLKKIPTGLMEVNFLQCSIIMVYAFVVMFSTNQSQNAESELLTTLQNHSESWHDWKKCKLTSQNRLVKKRNLFVCQNWVKFQLSFEEDLLLI